jgi:biotin carboxyl carrier protein
MKKYKFTIRGNDYDVHILSMEDNIAEIEVNGTLYEVELKQEMKMPKTPKLVRPKPLPTRQETPAPAAGMSTVTAPLPGTILKINVRPGDEVKNGQVLLVMEAMKMENNILSEKDGVVKSVTVQEGSNVLEGDVLIEIE